MTIQEMELLIKPQNHYGKSSIKISRDRNEEFEPIVIPKYECTVRALKSSCSLFMPKV